MDAKIVTTCVTGLAGAGIIGGGAFYYFQTRDISISKQIEKNGRKLLDQNDFVGRWDIKLNTYKREKGKLSIKIEPEDVPTLKTTCEKKLSTNFNKKDTKLYDDLNLICTRPTNKERFFNDKKDLVEESGWAQKVQNYKSVASGSDLIAEISRETVDENMLKRWCNKEIEKEYNNDEEYTIASMWCTKQGRT